MGMVIPKPAFRGGFVMNKPGSNFGTKDPQAAGFLAGVAEVAAAVPYLSSPAPAAVASRPPPPPAPAETSIARHKNTRRRLEEAVDTFLNGLPGWRCGQRDVGTLGGDDEGHGSPSRSRSRSQRKSRKEKDKRRRRSGSRR